MASDWRRAGLDWTWGRNSSLWWWCRTGSPEKRCMAAPGSAQGWATWDFEQPFSGICSCPWGRLEFMIFEVHSNLNYSMILWPLKSLTCSRILFSVNALSHWSLHIHIFLWSANHERTLLLCCNAVIIKLQYTFIEVQWHSIIQWKGRRFSCFF